MYRIRIANCFDSIDQIVEIGSKYRFKDFCKLNRAFQEELICKSVNKEVLRKIRSKLSLPETEVSISGTKIEFISTIRFVAFGKDKYNNDLEEEFKKTLKVFGLTNPRIEFNSINYDFEFEPENYDTDWLIKKFKKTTALESFSNFKIYKIKIHEEDVSTLKAASTLEFWVNNLPDKIEYNRGSKQAIIDFIDTLNDSSITDAISSEVILMTKIYDSLKKVFPEFRELSRYKQVKILDESYTRARIIARSVRDIHLFAKATFEVLASHNLHSRFILEGREYRLSREYRHDRIVDDLIFRNEIRMMEYNYTTAVGHTITCCFKPYDLWHLIATGGNTDDHVFGEIA